MLHGLYHSLGAEVYMWPKNCIAFLVVVCLILPYCPLDPWLSMFPCALWLNSWHLWLLRLIIVYSWFLFQIPWYCWHLSFQVLSLSFGTRKSLTCKDLSFEFIIFLPSCVISSWCAADLNLGLVLVSVTIFWHDEHDRRPSLVRSRATLILDNKIFHLIPCFEPYLFFLD